MAERDPSLWPPDGETLLGADSIAAEVASRIDAVPPAPGDAMDWASVAARYEREAAAQDDRPGAAPLLFEAGRIYEERLAAPDAALVFYRRALAVDGRFLPNLRATRRLAMDRGDDALAVEVLAAEADATPEPPARAELLRLRGRLLGALGREADARQSLAQAEALVPEGFESAEEAARAAARLGDRVALVDAYQRCARALEDVRLGAHYLLAASAVAAEGLDDLDRAASLARDAFARCPSDALVRSAARFHAARIDDLPWLAEVLRADAAGASGGAAARVLLELARAEERLGHPDQAVALLERAWLEAPDDPRVLSELAQLREARREWEAAADALEGLAAAHLARGGAGHRLEAIAAKLRRMEIEEAELGRFPEAIACCRDVLALDAAQRTALATLGRLCARTGDWAGVHATFLAEAEAAREPRERAQRLFKAAQVLEERLARPGEAAQAYRAALHCHPDLLAARSALERLLERSARWDDLAALLEGDLARGTPPAEQVETLLRLARLDEERRGDPAAAAGRYRRILELEPENAGALHLLRLTLERLGPGDELGEVLAREAARAPDPRRRLALLQRRAEVLEEAGGDPEGAVAAWDAVLAADAGHLPALRALGRLHAAAGSWGRVAELFRAEGDASADPAQAAELLLRAGEVFERRLERPDAALAAYREAVTLAPAHLPALAALSRLHRARGDHEALADVLRALGAAREAPEEHAAVLSELGQLCEEQLGDRGRALEAYQEALRADPRYVPALRAAERLCVVLGRGDEVAALRRAALEDAEAGDRAERLLRLAWLEAERGRDPEAALRAARALAAALPGSPAPELLELRLAPEPERRARAREALALMADAASAAVPEPPSAQERRDALDPGAAALEPSSPILEPEAERQAREAGEHAALARLAAERGAAAADPAERAAWAVQAGEAWERAGDPNRALAAYQSALSSAPAHLPALRAVRTLFAGRREWGAVRASLQAEGGALQDGNEAAAAWREAGAIAEQWFGDVGGAVQDYRRALERAPADPVALTRVEALLATHGLVQLADVHAARARAERDPHRAADAWLAAARACTGAPAEREAALAHLDRALELQGDLAAALELRARLRAEAGQPAPALADLDRCLALGGSAANRIPLHLAAAALCHEALGDPAGALHHVEAALALAPERVEALARLARLHREGGRVSEAAAVLRRLSGLAGLPRDTQLEHGFALAELEADLGEVEAARSACRRVLDLDPGHPGALRLLVELERRRGDPAALATALGEASSAARDTALRGNAHLEAARLHAGPLRDGGRAVEHLRAALELDPERDDVRAALAEVAEERLPALALDQHRRLIARDPLRTASWTALYRLLERTRQHDGAFVAATVLRWLGTAPPGPGAERLLLEGDRQTLGPPPALPAADWELVRAPGDRGPLADVVAAAGDALAGVLVDPHETRGAPVRGDHAFRRTLAELAAALGAGDFELYAAPIGRLSVEPGEPAAVCVGADLAHRSTLREQRFLLGRVAARLRTRSALAEAFPERFADAVGAAVRQVVPHYTALGQPDDELARRVGKALSRRARRALEEPARALAHLRPPPDLSAWRAAAGATADRAGLILCGDPPTALDLLLRGAGGKPSVLAERLAAVRARPDALALLAFVATEAHLTLRQRLRVAIA